MNFRFRVTSCVAILSSATLLCLPGTRTFEDGRNRFPPETSVKMNQYWDMYKARYNKTYSENMEAARRIAWEKNLVTIYKHNMMAAAGHHSYTLRDNHIADLGTRQYVRNMVKLIPSRKRRVSNALMVGAVLHDPQLDPPRLDWREAGFQTPPENQQSCGSCYAYSVAGSIEGQIFKRTGMLIPLSVQQLVDCSITTGNLGCAGGSLRNTLRYLEKARGLMDRAEYPYKGRQGPCHFQEAASVVNITSWAVLPARDEQALEAAVATIGPIAASINASPKTFQLYHQGVYDDETCSSDKVNHAVLIVGYTPTEWILKNWWGDGWGVADSKKCRQSSNHLTGFNPAACFTFYLPNELQFVDVTSAQLWFYKEYDENDDLNQTFVLSELDHWDLDGNFEKNTMVAIFETDIGEGWVKADVSFTLNKWVEELRLNHAIQIACSTCSIDRDTAPVSIEMTLKPFLVIHTSPLPQKNRPKRNSNCLPEMKECCRDELYINFEDIGWSDWILHPSGYHAYFCRGSCSSAASLTASGSAYNNVIRRLLARRGNTMHRKSEIVPCCSPTQLSAIQLLYVDSNNTITQKTLPNMVVEACGCM